MFMILTRGDTPHGNADMAKLADAHDSGSCGKPCRFKSCYPHQQKESSTNSTAFFLPFRIAERLEPAVQPPGRRAPPFWRLLPPFPPLNGGIYLLSAPQKEGSTK